LPLIFAALRDQILRHGGRAKKSKAIIGGFEMKSTKSVDSSGESMRDCPNLDGLYGKIGISAVAAAMRYQSAPRNPAYAPAFPRNDE
jgi:hypothetical protein